MGLMEEARRHPPRDLCPGHHEPNELVAQIHDRLALILHPKDYDRWLGIPMSGDPRPLLDLLHPYDASRMKMTPANPAIGNWRNNGPEMLDGPK
jgi:putative SOS response-associated peptidase YedK